jgi:hypothetical protein
VDFAPGARARAQMEHSSRTAHRKPASALPALELGADQALTFQAVGGALSSQALPSWPKGTLKGTPKGHHTCLGLVTVSKLFQSKSLVTGLIAEFSLLRKSGQSIDVDVKRSCDGHGAPSVN